MSSAKEKAKKLFDTHSKVSGIASAKELAIKSAETSKQLSEYHNQKKWNDVIEELKNL